MFWRSEGSNNVVIDTEKAKSRLDDLVSALASEMGASIVYFSPAYTGYQQVNSKCGSFYVSLQHIDKYANGYKTTFHIGNPSLVTYNNLGIVLGWGKSYLTRRTKEHTIVNDILPGIWNKVTVVLSPAKEEDIELIILQINGCPSLSLRHDLRKSND